jgi:hypothetical protein
MVRKGDKLSINAANVYVKKNYLVYSTAGNQTWLVRRIRQTGQSGDATADEHRFDTDCTDEHGFQTAKNSKYTNRISGFISAFSI